MRGLARETMIFARSPSLISPANGRTKSPPPSQSSTVLSKLPRSPPSASPGFLSVNRPPRMPCFVSVPPFQTSSKIPNISSGIPSAAFIPRAAASSAKGISPSGSRRVSPAGKFTSIPAPSSAANCTGDSSPNRTTNRFPSTNVRPFSVTSRPPSGKSTRNPCRGEPPPLTSGSRVNGLSEPSGCCPTSASGTTLPASSSGNSAALWISGT